MNPVATVLTSLDISEVEKERQALVESAFTTKEKDYLSTRHIRSTAGWLALKKSIVKLVEENSNYVLGEKDIVLQCLADGRPVISDIVTSVGFARNLFVSISHTRTTAHGLAVLQEG